MVSAGGARPWVLGIASSHNGAVCLMHGDEVVVAVQEERLLRSKRARLQGAHTGLALAYCLDHAGITAADLDAIVVCAQHEIPEPHDGAAGNPAFAGVRSDATWLSIPHHLGHAFGAFATSGLERAAVLVIDGVGSRVDAWTEAERALAPHAADADAETISIYRAEAATVTPVEKHFVARGEWVHHPAGTGPLPLGLAPGLTRGMPSFGSLGGMYSAAGWQVFGDGMDGAGKLMGLAPYGRPTIPVEAFFDVVDHRFVFHDHVPRRFDHDARWPARGDEYRDLAASTQRALEVALLRLASRARELGGADALCYAGGVALNSVANERLVRESPFARIFFMPAAEDSGTALGAAYYGLWQLTGRNARRPPAFDSLGRRYARSDVDEAIARTPGIEVVSVPDVIGETADRLAAGAVVGWFEGGSELGPRALGKRSILCDPRDPEAKARLNGRVKHREAFRPFAPMILREEASRWFEIDDAHCDSPYMLRVARFRPEKRALVPGVVHVDGTGRLQTITREANGRIYDLIQAFHRRTSVPILLNTSFNVAGEPIVEDPDDALWCMLFTGVDCCVLEGKMVTKRGGPSAVLDLRIHLAADSMATVRYVAGGALKDQGALPFPTPVGVAAEAEIQLERIAASARLDHLRVHGANPWGRVVHVTETALARFFELLSPAPTGRELLAKLVDAPFDDRRWDEASLVRLIAALRRAAIVKLSSG